MAIEETLRELIREVILQEMPQSLPRAPRPLLSADEVGQRLGIDKQAVYRLKREGALKAVNLSETRFRFHPDEVDRFIENGGVSVKPCPLTMAPRKVARGGTR